MSDREEPQSALFDLRPAWTEHWVGMPEYVHEDLMPWRSVQVHFECEEDLQLFAERICRKMTDKTKSVWYPEDENERPANTRYADEDSELERDEPAAPIAAIAAVAAVEPIEQPEREAPRDLFDLL